MKDEFKITYSRGSGPGGQRKNKVETCVEIEHLETGMKERCQDTPSQSRNLDIALKRLVDRLDKHQEQVRLHNINNMRKKILEQKKPIRTYNFPRNEVKDHRTGKVANLKRVLSGALNLLRWQTGL